MKWKDRVVEELSEQNMFQSSAHRSRFKELLDCYVTAPFFTRGLCKCMYLSCWDEEHFIIMLDMLNKLKLSENMDLQDMNENGELMAEEAADSYDNYVMRLSCALLMGEPFDVEALPQDMDPQGRFLIQEALKASEIIDSVPDK
ncbi:MAG: hypothetical protein MRZ74_10270 [Blautia sp.]|nr:hypothetical protein [Blautia sp.]MDY5031688.1 hypothetical protein [Blautia sp.]